MAVRTRAEWDTRVLELVDSAGTPRITASDMRSVLDDLGDSVVFMDEIVSVIDAAVGSDAWQGGGDSVLTGLVDGRLPVSDTTMALGWSLTQDIDIDVFTRDGNHPTDGAVIATSAGVDIPPFPPAFVTAGESFAYLHWWVAGTAEIKALGIGSGIDPYDFLYGDSGPLTLDGEAGTVYVATRRIRALMNFAFLVIPGGPLVLTENDVENWAKTGDATLIPADKLTNAP